MTKREINTKELLNEFNQSLNGWTGDLEIFIDFVRTALTQRQYDIMNEDKEFKPTLKQWGDLKVNSDSLITMLERLEAYQKSNEYQITQIN